MIRAEAGGRANARPEAMFDFLVDLKNLPEWSGVAKSVEQVTPGAIEDGTRFRGKFKNMGSVDWVAADLARPNRFSYHASPKTGSIRHSWTFTPDGDGTRFSNALEVRARGIALLFTPLMRRAIRRRVAEVVTEVQAHFK